GLCRPPPDGFSDTGAFSRRQRKATANSGFVSQRLRGNPLLGSPWRGAGAVERGGLENRCPSCGGPRVRIPPSPPSPSFVSCQTARLSLVAIRLGGRAHCISARGGQNGAVARDRKPGRGRLSPWRFVREAAQAYGRLGMFLRRLPGQGRDGVIAVRRPEVL